MWKATGGYRTYSIPGKAAALVPVFAVKDLPSVELKAYVPALAMKGQPSGRKLG